MSSIRSIREERSESNRIPVFGLIRNAFVSVRKWWCGNREVKPRTFAAPKGERR